MVIQPIVEGYAEVAAFPVLLRRLVEEAQAWTVNIGRPIRRSRPQLVQKAGVEEAVRLALKEQDCDAILFLFDGDDDCPAELGPIVQAWAAAVATHIPCSVVIAHREYEAWFLSAIESLRGHRGVLDDADPHLTPETPRDAKGQLEARMQADTSYLPTTDQPAFSATFSLSDAYRRSRSFQKLASSFGHLVSDMGEDIGVWPPAAWTESD